MPKEKLLKKRNSLLTACLVVSFAANLIFVFQATNQELLNFDTANNKLYMNEIDQLRTEHKHEIEKLNNTIEYLTNAYNLNLSNREQANKQVGISMEKSSSNTDLSSTSTDKSPDLIKINEDLLTRKSEMEPSIPVLPSKFNSNDLPDMPLPVFFGSEEFSAAENEHNSNYAFAKKYTTTKLKRNLIKAQSEELNWDRDLVNNALYEQEQEENEMKNQYGDDEYDRSLIEAGFPNRLAVSNILDMSPAYNAGLRIGDIIISYGGKRVFDWPDLKSNEIEHNNYNDVVLIISRAGETKELLVPAGPIGALFIRMLYRS